MLLRGMWTVSNPGPSIRGWVVPLSISGRASSKITAKTSKAKKQVPMGKLELQPVLVLLKLVFFHLPFYPLSQ